jgi:hypothetical protein
MQYGHVEVQAKLDHGPLTGPLFFPRLNLFYLGPFLVTYKDQVTNQWNNRKEFHIKKDLIACSPHVHTCYHP